MKRAILQKTLPLITSGLLLLALAGCMFMPQVDTVEPEEQDEILEISEPIADNLLEGMNTSDYAVFSRDFDDAMKKALDEDAFEEMTQEFSGKIGAYQSRILDHMERIENLVTVVYTAQFENEEEVTIRLTLREGEPYQVAGLYFDSPKLREE